MSKNSQYRVRKHRALQTARKKEIKYVNEITARSSNLEDYLSNSERNKNGKCLLVFSYMYTGHNMFFFIHI